MINVVMKVIRVLVMLALALMGTRGLYFPEHNLIVCMGERACIHEGGHMLDRELGRPSQTEGFQEAIDEHYPRLLKRTSCDTETEECLYKEAYARLWELVKGDIEEISDPLKEYYEEGQ